MKFTKKNIILGLIAFAILIQLIRIDKSAPKVDPATDFLTMSGADAVSSKLIKDACYDCHSYETKYPWYSDFAPVSWFLKNHVNEGREHLNFSTFGTFPLKKQKHKLEECVEMMEKKEMPMTSYTWMHPEAVLSDEQNQGLIAFFKSKFEATPAE